MDLMGTGDSARLSPKALRLYDEVGLVPTARVGVDSGPGRAGRDVRAGA